MSALLSWQGCAYIGKRLGLVQHPRHVVTGEEGEEAWNELEAVKVTEVVRLTPTISQGIGRRADGSLCEFYGDTALMEALAGQIAEGHTPEAQVPVGMIRPA